MMYSFGDIQLEKAMQAIADKLTELQDFADSENMIGLSPYFMDCTKALENLNRELETLTDEISNQM